MPPIQRRWCPSGPRPAPSCCSWPVVRPGVTLLSSARVPAWDPRSSPGRWNRVAADYVSPFDERVRTPEPLALRPASVAGRRVVLLHIRKNRGAEFLDRIETLLAGAGAATARVTKEIFSKPAALSLIDEIATGGGLVVEALAD